jgi:hypothetical protein
METNLETNGIQLWVKETLADKGRIHSKERTMSMEVIGNLIRNRQRLMEGSSKSIG